MVYSKYTATRLVPFATIDEMRKLIRMEEETETMHWLLTSPCNVCGMSCRNYSVGVQPNHTLAFVCPIHGHFTAYRETGPVNVVHGSGLDGLSKDHG